MTSAAAVAACAAAAALAGCGGSDRPATPRGFAWVGAPAARTARWPRALLPAGRVSVPYPAGWKQIHSDPGTVTAALTAGHGRFTGYLNLTPQQGSEDLSGWARFRAAHNREEGDRAVRVVASAENLPFRAGVGSCVVDDYRTDVASYRELACIVDGKRATTVAVGAAPPVAWPRQGPLIERAIAAIDT